ncbi:PREDICTED: myb family transcription factor EFM-like [Nelumbo nucifera]|uniref:HTH myb-type domain-containing protein n=2 Tax=Nelumbo nucifera TaxID=4432 RepID=A0A822ZN63_NELNU|nr:PREDICTED: myb family transcription factor EFM-like [Nelumbo nucifera]DAD44809.1 TPA_asm: hypothetical protein HUJ06_003039 [Nelumbo nucifera]
MGSPAELSLDYKPNSYSLLLKTFGDQTQNLEEILSRLEEERIKIDGLKRELPLCMQLLTNAMEALRQQLQTYRTNQGPRPVLEEFIPLKHSGSEGSEKAASISEKVSWMTTAQLWSQSSDGINKEQATVASAKEGDHCFSVSPKLALDNKQRNGGAFLPFSKEKSSCATPTLSVLPELALASTNKEMEDKKRSESDNGVSVSCSTRDNSCSKAAGGGGTPTTEKGNAGGNAAEAQPTATTQTHRKARRCWSPDLHRRFVNALQILGGSHVATPKQIRELMKVDGLTNDEVKSHLQKYRLHTRRPSPSPQVAGTPAPQLVVLGGIWVPPEYATAAAAAAAHPAAASTIYGAHPASHPSTHYCAPAVAQEFYPTPPHHQLHHSLHPQQHIYKASSQTHSSPESDGRPAGDGSESIEDGKSENSSWKGDSGENGGDRKGLGSMRDDGDDQSNGSEITLKF